MKERKSREEYWIDHFETESLRCEYYIEGSAEFLAIRKRLLADGIQHPERICINENLVPFYSFWPQGLIYESDDSESYFSIWYSVSRDRDTGDVEIKLMDTAKEIFDNTILEKLIMEKLKIYEKDLVKNQTKLIEHRIKEYMETKEKEEMKPYKAY